MIKKIILLIVILLMVNIGYTQNSSSCPPPQPSSSPGGDTPDDNYSYSIGSNDSFRIVPNVLIYKNGFYQAYLNNLGVKQKAFTIITDMTAQSLLASGPIIIFPTGSLFGLENDSTLKTVLQEYVRLGGVILVLAQQFGEHYEKVVPLPEGAQLRALGWREDQSCFWGSAYHTTQNNVPHPIFSGVGGESVDVGVDGYFSTIPAEATVLLRRKMNQEPVMISYPYGEGTVILTSLFSDYANAHSQMSGMDEAHIVRDLLTYARNVKRSIPSWLLTSNQLMTFSLPEVDIHNDSDVAAARAKFRVLSPDRKRELYTVEQAVAIDPQATANAAIEFSFTPNGLYEDLLRNWIGIFHVEVELYDLSGNLIQPYSESDGGAFV